MSQENVEVVRALRGAWTRRTSMPCAALDRTSSATSLAPIRRGPGSTSRRMPGVQRGLCGLPRRRLGGLPLRSRASSSTPGTASCSCFANPGAAREAACDELAIAGRLHAPRREDRPRTRVPRPRRGPRSRGAVGVGDVAGERGDRAQRRSALRRAATRRVAASLSIPTSSGYTRSGCPERRRYRGHRGESGASRATGFDACDDLRVEPERAASTRRPVVARRSHRRDGQRQRRPIECATRDVFDAPRREDRRGRESTGPGRGPRSRGAVGVADVAGERGADSRRLRAVECRRLLDARDLRP